MKDKTIIYIYNSFKDPLFQNLMYKYIQTLTDKGLAFYLITFEQPEYAISEDEKSEIKDSLLKKGITWKPFKHSTGRFLLLKKFYDLFSVFFTLLRWRLFGRAKNIFAFANVSASHSVIYSKLMGLKLFIYSYEPHAAFQVELGLWDSNSLKYKILNYFEKLAAQSASLVFTGTKYGVELIHSIAPKTLAYRLPTSVNENEFFYHKKQANEWLNKNGLTQKKVVLYLGNFGDLYYSPDKLITFYEGLYQIDNTYHFVVITSYSLPKIKNLIEASNIPSEAFYLDTKISYDDVKIIISASLVGMSIVPPLENQKYRSPTKVAEYLLCGLPFITCKGVSEDDLVAEEHHVGAVIDELSPQYAKHVDNQISNWLNDREGIRKKCREIGISYRGKSNVDKAFNNLLLPLLTKENA
jgi:hypothetical protein